MKEKNLLKHKNIESHLKGTGIINKTVANKLEIDSKAYSPKKLKR